ncbi:MAG: TadE family protein [Pseudomonadota bacterium]
MRPRHRPPSKPGQAGTSAVEFALVLTLMISLIAMVIDLGRSFWYYDALLKGTRDAARAMSVADKAGIASIAVPDARQLLVEAVNAAGVPGFGSANVKVTCLDSVTLADATCTDGTAPGGARVEIIDYTVTLGQYVPFLVGSASSSEVTLAPRATMRYIK